MEGIHNEHMKDWVAEWKKKNPSAGLHCMHAALGLMTVGQLDEVASVRFTFCNGSGIYAGTQRQNT